MERGKLEYICLFDVWREIKKIKKNVIRKYDIRVNNVYKCIISMLRNTITMIIYLFNKIMIL